MEEYTVQVFDDRTEWYKNGKLHRVDGPAVECSDGHKEYFQNGLRHRLDGPAVEYSTGYKAYWINNEKLSEKEFLSRNNFCSAKTVIVDDKKYKLVPV